MLDRLRGSDRNAVDEVLPLLYRELRRVAAGYLRRERHGHTLEPTALVHEAYIRLVGRRDVEWQNRAHFLGLAAQTMRRIHSRRIVTERRRSSRLPRRQSCAGPAP